MSIIKLAAAAVVVNVYAMLRANNVFNDQISSRPHSNMRNVTRINVSSISRKAFMIVQAHVRYRHHHRHKILQNLREFLKSRYSYQTQEHK